MSSSLIQVKGSELTRILVNADLWLDPEVSPAWIQFLPTGIRVFSTDGFVAMTDFASYEGSVETLEDEPAFFIDESSVTKILLASRKVAAKPLEIVVHVDKFDIPYGFQQDDKENWILSKDEGSTSFIDAAEPPPWGDVFELNHEDSRDVHLHEVAIRAERFLKLSRVRADKLAPIDMKFIEPWNEKAPGMALVKIGPTFRAAVNLVNRQVALQNIEEEKRGYFW